MSGRIHVPKKKFVFHANMTQPAGEEDSLPVLKAVSGPNDPLEVEANKARYKVSNVCAHCVHWYEGRDRDLKSEDGQPICAAPGRCGGLPVVLPYPHYKGPLSLEELQKKCAVCGGQADKSFAVATDVGQRRIGYCGEHWGVSVKMAKQFAASRGA